MPELRDTYHAALQHGHVEPDGDDLVVGVVRRPIYGIENYLDRNVSELAPPDDLLAEFKDLAAESTHDEAWAALDFAGRYREHLETPDARAAMADLLAELETRDVWLVCYENTDDKRCHRTILAEELRAKSDAEA